MHQLILLYSTRLCIAYKLHFNNGLWNIIPTVVATSLTVFDKCKNSSAQEGKSTAERHVHKQS